MPATGARPAWADRWDERVLAARGRLATRAPVADRGLRRTEHGTRRFVDAVLPPARVVPLAIALIVATVLDSAATYLWVTERIAVEGNPLVDGLMASFGDGPALTMRAMLSASLIVLLTWLATRHWEARLGMLLAAVALGGVTLLHVYGATLLFG